MSDFDPTQDVPRQGPKQVAGPNDEPTPGNITPESLDANLEEKVVELDVDAEETPPDPGLIVVRNAYGPGTFSVKWPDGTPLGVWLSVEMPDEPGAVITMALKDIGLEPALAEWFGKQRDAAIAARNEMAGTAAVQNFAMAEKIHEEKTAAMREAFLKKMKETR